MEKLYIHQIVPENKTGKALDVTKTVIEKTLDEAMLTFKKACKRLQNPALWQKLSGGKLSAAFELAGDTDNTQQRLIQVKDFIRIDIPGPGPAAGDGYDWVQVKELAALVDKEADESFGLTLAAALNPQKRGERVAHFFKEGATSSFIIKRNGNAVTAFYHGRNELPNTEAFGVADKLRNVVVAAGAICGLSELQWKALIKGFLQKEAGY